MAKLFANSGDPEKTLQNGASDLTLHCLPITHLGISRIKWVKRGKTKSRHKRYASRDDPDLFILRKILVFSEEGCHSFSQTFHHFPDIFEPPSSPYSCPQPPNLPTEHLLSENKTII